MTQPFSLFDLPPLPPSSILGDRDGETFNRARDLYRLNDQALDVWTFMADGKPHLPREIEAGTGHEWASISARLRDFRKQKYGGHTVERVGLGNGLFSYRLIESKAGRS